MKKKIGSEAKEVAWWIQQVKELRACSEKTPGLEEAIEGFEAAIGRVTARYANEGRLSEIASAVRRMPKPTDLQLLVIKAWKNLVSRTVRRAPPALSPTPLFKSMCSRFTRRTLRESPRCLTRPR